MVFFLCGLLKFNAAQVQFPTIKATQEVQFPTIKATQEVQVPTIKATQEVQLPIKIAQVQHPIKLTVSWAIQSLR